MIKKAPEIKIPPKQPFKNDILQRQECAETLTKIISPVRDPLVVAIDAPFGSGKTTFVKMWRQYLQNKRFKTLWFNAWENDFTENALISILGEFREELKKANQPEGSRLIDAAVKAGAIIAKNALPIALKIGVASMPGAESLIRGVSDMTESIAKERIEAYEADKNTIENFRKELAAFVEEKSPNKPVVFFIDELDRCRPLFAIEVLEHAKHLFRAKGLVFVLSIDKTQLGHSLRAVYGAGMDVDGYLRRLIDLEYRMPAPEMEKFLSALAYRMNASKLEQDPNARVLEDGLTAFKVWAKIFTFSLRTVEQAFSHFCLAMRLIPKNRFYGSILATLVCFRHKDPALYERYIKREQEIPDILDDLKCYSESARGNEKHFVEWLRVILSMFNLNEDARRNWLHQRSEITRQSNVRDSAQVERAREEHTFVLGAMRHGLGREPLVQAVELTVPMSRV